MDRAEGRKKVERFEGAARVRIHARRRDGSKVPMVGLVPRAALAELRRRAREQSGSGEARIEAQPLRLEVVQVTFERTRKSVAARRLTLSVAVRAAVPDAGGGAKRKKAPVEIVLAAERSLARPVRPGEVAKEARSQPVPGEAVEA